MIQNFGADSQDVIRYDVKLTAISLSNTHGLSAELRGEIAVIALWSKTATWTGAMNMLAGDEARAGSMKANILADATHAIACRLKTVSGNFYIDEEVLKEEGTSDFKHFAEVPDASLQPDFSLPDHVVAQFDKEILKNIGTRISGSEIKADTSSVEQQI